MRNLFNAFCIIVCIGMISCNKDTDGETGPYPDLGKIWSAEVAVTEDNGMPVKNPKWDLVDVSVSQHASLSASDANIGGLKHCLLLSPDTATDLDITYNEESWDGTFGISTTAAYMGTGEVVDENNMTLDVGLTVTDPFFGNFNGRFVVNMTRLNGDHEVIDDQLGVDGSGSTSSALTVETPEIYIDDPELLKEAMQHINLLKRNVPSFMHSWLENAYMNRALEITNLTNN